MISLDTKFIYLLLFIKDELDSFIDYEPNTKGFKQVVDTFGKYSNETFLLPTIFKLSFMYNAKSSLTKT